MFIFKKMSAKCPSLNSHNSGSLFPSSKNGIPLKKKASSAHKNYFPWDIVLWNVAEMLVYILCVCVCIYIYIYTSPCHCVRYF